MRNKKSLVRITTVPLSLEKLLGDQLLFMNSYYDVTAVSSGYNDLKKIAKKNNIKFECVNLTRKITPLYDLFAFFKLFLYFKKNKPFIVHTHTPKAGLIGMLASYFAGVPNRLHTVAGLPLMETSGFLKRLLIITEKITYFSSTMIYPNSYGLFNYILENNFCDLNKLKVIGNGSSNGINTNYFKKNNSNILNISKISLGYNDNNTIFIYVGRLVKDKGINELINAFVLLNKQYDKCRLLILGEYEHFGNSLSPDIIKEIDTNNKINLIGFKSDIRPYLNVSDCLILPSYREGLPNVLLQAGAMNLSCITTNIIGNNEVIKHNYNGLLIEPKNTSNLFEAMKYIIQNPVQNKKMGENSRKLIIDKYEQTFVWHELLKEYNSF
jgi:glycosyltransferase involved in cell wall biosynthesis